MTEFALLAILLGLAGFVIVSAMQMLQGPRATSIAQPSKDRPQARWQPTRLELLRMGFTGRHCETTTAAQLRADPRWSVRSQFATAARWSK
jgi:hypothetical protein